MPDTVATFPTVALTEAEIRLAITALETALARGEDTVQFSDRLVRYKSNSAILDAIAYYKSLLAEATGGRSKQFRGVACNGF